MIAVFSGRGAETVFDPLPRAIADSSPMLAAGKSLLEALRGDLFPDTLRIKGTSPVAGAQRGEADEAQGVMLAA